MNPEDKETLNNPHTQRKSRISCCVVGCSNGYYNTDTSVKFYAFPNKWYEKERKNIWINSVNRIRSGETKGPWQPTSHSKICSVHFVGNEKSNDPRNPSYNPTIFPENYRKTTSGTADSKKHRYQRLLKRCGKQDQSYSGSTPALKIDDEISDENILLMEIGNVKEDFSCQVDFDHYTGDSSFLFECTIVSSCEFATQCHIPSDQNKLFLHQEDKCVGNDDVIECEGFHGYKSLQTNEELNCLAGVLFDRFALLLSLLTSAHKNSKLNLENRLFLFLMKMKLGLSFSALAVIFQLHQTTCSRIFLSVLEELSQKTKDFVFWPNRSIIDKTMPKAFQLHFPKCRAIIDCTEIKIQQPKKVDQRILTYSQYKSTFTAKFLISISPTGFISFVSKCYGGRTTDTFITNDCGFLDLLEPNDLVLADKGFPGIKCKDDVVLVLPPFVHEGHLSHEEVEETYTIASVRIHVERSIQRVKTYNILNKIPYNLFLYLDDIVRMCCVLTNLQQPTIADSEDDDDDDE